MIKKCQSLIKLMRLLKYYTKQILSMSDPQKPQNPKQQRKSLQIDDPGMFLSLDSHPISPVQPQQRHQQNQNQNDGRSESLSNDEQYVPEAVQQQEIKNDELDMYEPESDNLQDDEEQQKSESNKQKIQLTQKLPITQTLKPVTENQEKESKNAPKRRKRGKKKMIDSPDDEDYSGQYGVRKKAKPKDTKKISKRNQSTGRSRGKPRGRTPNAMKNLQVKKEYIYPDEMNSDRAQRQRLNSRRPQPLSQGPSYVMAPFNSNWRVSEQNQQDWDSQNASIWSESANKRADYASDIIKLIEGNPENIVSLIANLPPLLYTTFH